MSHFTLLSPSEQVAAHLRGELARGIWRGTMPGVPRLATALGIDRKTVEAALRLLEREGLLIPQGAGRSRRIMMTRDALTAHDFRVRILLYEKQARGDIDNSSLLALLLEAGFDVDFAAKSLKDLGMRVERVARHVLQNPADAWVVSAGAREILEWFAGQSTPAIAMYGRAAGLPMAAAFPMMIPGQTEAVRRLLDLGHRRIVMLAREERRKPELSRPEQVFIETLEAAGIRTGDYNLPDWEESREGLKHRLDSLFRHSPPTALIFQEAPIFVAARLHLADRGIVAPRDVSLVVADRDPSFLWCHPIPSHIHWDYRPVVRRVVNWAKNVAAGKDDRRQRGNTSEFVEGGTIGVAKK